MKVILTWQPSENVKALEWLLNKYDKSNLSLEEEHFVQVVKDLVLDLKETPDEKYHNK